MQAEQLGASETKQFLQSEYPHFCLLRFRPRKSRLSGVDVHRGRYAAGRRDAALHAVGGDGRRRHDGARPDHPGPARLPLIPQHIADAAAARRLEEIVDSAAYLVAVIEDRAVGLPRTKRSPEFVDGLFCGASSKRPD